MRFLYTLAVFVLLSSSALAQRDQEFPALVIQGSPAISTTAFNYNPNLPSIFFPQDSTVLLPPPSTARGQWLGGTLFFRVETNGDTTDLAPVLNETPVTGQGAVALKANGAPAIGCTTASDLTTDIANPSALAGKIVFVQRGVCNFVHKVTNAVAAGAIGVIIYNGVDREGAEGPLRDVVPFMGSNAAAPPYTGSAFTIPSITLINGIAQPIIDEIGLGSPVTLSIRAELSSDNGAVAAEPTVGTTASGLEVRGANPFATTTQLRVTSEFAEVVRVEVYNVRGQLVRTLLDGVVAGERMVSLSSEGLAAGVYFVRATGETFRSQQQVTVLR